MSLLLPLKLNLYIKVWKKKTVLIYLSGICVGTWQSCKNKLHISNCKNRGEAIPFNSMFENDDKGKCAYRTLPEDDSGPCLPSMVFMA